MSPCKSEILFLFIPLVNTLLYPAIIAMAA
jgi:hypothetical protein